MDFLDLIRLMFRRWYVTLPVVVVTLGAAYAVGSAIQPEYKTSVAIVLVPPTVAVAAPAPGESPQPANPWLRVGESAMAQAVQISTSAHDARSRVAAAGGDPGYQVELVQRSSILTVEVAAATREQALVTVEATTRLINDEVARQQAPYGSRGGEQITTQVLDAGLNITPSRSNVLRVQITMVCLGLLLAAGAAVGWDAMTRRRAAARTGQHRGGPDDRPVDDDGPRGADRRGQDDSRAQDDSGPHGDRGADSRPATAADHPTAGSQPAGSQPGSQPAGEPGRRETAPAGRSA
ncbi:hypothetical protein O7627_05860 [Solwaraspora sp. WMMD1047]|uniref:hypothetical protein n=1 Tax=Solwaraspora sp. WMMD1047 TaxID=3016102 RepID=UPI002415A980|nr:hypothetical protein [Solwaraspora sp. WMMD1047]MDG4828830.1 hypothetical protein [Solwaraspora sp. WMMD1047]